MELVLWSSHIVIVLLIIIFHFLSFEATSSLHLFSSVSFSMASSKADGKRRLTYDQMEEDQSEDEEEDEQEEEEDQDVGRELGFGENFKKKKTMTAAAASSSRRGSGNVGGPATPSCQADNCDADLTASKRYHRRHKVCEFHAKAPAVAVAGIQQRFCQQCSRFHGLLEFDETKRSCRKRLAGHNQRRRKSSSDIHGESST